jgi:hypothetical protein
MTKPRLYRRILLIGALAGVIVASPMTYIASKENPQGEFNDDDGQLSGVSLALQVFAPWFVASCGLVFIVGVVLSRLPAKRD